MPAFQRPLSEEQLKALKEPSPQQLLKAQDDLFLNLLLRVAELEAKLEKKD